MSNSQIITADEFLDFAPTGHLVERIAESDRALIQRMEAEQLAAERLRAFVIGHLSAVYKLGQGDQIQDDGMIVRAAAEGAG